MTRSVAATIRKGLDGSYVHGFLMRMPRGAVRKGVRKDRMYKYTSDEARAEYRSVRLFKSKQEWWLYYAPGHCTGSFPSKKLAVEWFTGGGR